VKRRARLLAAVVAAGLPLAGVAEARPVNDVALSSLPPWAREAVTRSLPAASVQGGYLHHEQLVEPQSGGGVRVTQRVAARIVRPADLDDLSRWPVFYDEGDRVEHVRAWTLLPDGRVRRFVEEEDVVDLPAVSGAAVFEDRRMRLVTAPGAGVGSTVLFEHVVRHVLDLGAHHMVVGGDRPVVLARMALQIPPGWSHHAVGTGSPPPDRADTPQGVVLTWRDLISSPPEPLSPPSAELGAGAWVRWWAPDGSRGFSDWDAVGRWSEGLAQPVLAAAGGLDALPAARAPDHAGALLDAITAAFTYASREVRYVSIQIGLGGYRPHTPDAVVAHRFGDCKDKATLLRAFFRRWGLDARAVLVRTRHGGRVLADIPSPAQFDHMIVGVVLPEGVGADLWSAIPVPGVGRMLFLDGTQSGGSPWALREDVQGTLALVTGAERSPLVVLPLQPPQTSGERRRVEALAGPEGELVRAALVTRWSGTTAAAARSLHGSGSREESRTATEGELQETYPGASLVEHRIVGIDDPASDLVEEATLSGGRLGRRVGGLLVIEPGRGAPGVLRAGLPAGPRRERLDLGAPRESALEVHIDLPQGWVPESLPRAASLTTEAMEATASWTHGEGRLTYSRTVRLRMPEIPVEGYDAFRNSLMEVRAWDATGIAMVQKR
jgi:hypothetical protein